MQKKAGADTSALQAEVRSMGERISLLDEQVKGIDDEFKLMLAGIPNLPHASVPIGTSSDDNLEVSKWGAPPAIRLRSEGPLGPRPELGILDFERAAKITGARFACTSDWARN